jgi:hypothetical protein
VIFRIILETGPEFLAVVLFGSFPDISVSYDRQALKATRKEERVRERVTLIAIPGGGGMIPIIQ